LPGFLLLRKKEHSYFLLARVSVAIAKLSTQTSSSRCKNRYTIFTLLRITTIQ